MAYTFTCNVHALHIFANNTVSGADFAYIGTDGYNVSTINSSVSFDYANNPTTYIATNALSQDTVNTWILTSNDTINLQTFLVTTLSSTPQEIPTAQTLFPWTVTLQFTSSATNVNVFTSNTSTTTNGVSYGQLTTYSVGNVLINNGSSTGNPPNTITGVATVSALNGFTILNNKIGRAHV